MINSKIRRHSGRTEQYHEFDDGSIFSKQYYNEWDNYRDGFRNIAFDKTKKQPNIFTNTDWLFESVNKINKHVKQKLNVRKLKKRSF